jgi:heterodisulfide reductase subunit D
MDPMAEQEKQVTQPVTGANGNGHVREIEQEFVRGHLLQAYGCFSSGHKFCREVCPVYQVTRNEQYTPTAFHANVVAIEKGAAKLEDVAENYSYCTLCGGCELRCPNTLFVGDFYRNRTRTVKLVQDMRAAANKAGLGLWPKWQRWVEATMVGKNEPVLDYQNITPVDPNRVADWAKDLPFEIPRGGENILFVDCEAAYYRTSLPKAVAKILHAAGVPFGLMYEQWCCGGPSLEMGYPDHARYLAEHNVADWKKAGAKRVFVLDPHDYISFVDMYPQLFPPEELPEFVFMIDFVAQLLDEGKIKFVKPIEKTVTYHDPCRMNKRLGKWEAPRKILRAIPGLTFIDVDHVTQWAYCSGAGGGFAVEHPDLAKKIADLRISRAKELGVEGLVSACPWSERPLTSSGREQQLEVYDLLELVAEAMGLNS